MPSPIRKFIDLDLSFPVHPGTEDLVYVKDETAVKRALKNLLFTDYNERHYDPNFGVGIRQLLFEPMSFFTAFTLQEMIKDAINFFEPRVNLQYVLVTPDEDNNGYGIKIAFILNNVLTPIVVDFFLERIK